MLDATVPSSGWVKMLSIGSFGVVVPMRFHIAKIGRGLLIVPCVQIWSRTSGPNGRTPIHPCQEWRSKTNGQIQSSASIAADGIIYFGSFDPDACALNPGGAEQWIFETGDSVFANSAIASDGTV